MVNYKRVVCEVAVLSLLLSTTASAMHTCTEKRCDDSQSGVENIRVNIDGVVIAIGPAEALLEAAADFSDYIDHERNEIVKPSETDADYVSGSEDSVKPVKPVPLSAESSPSVNKKETSTKKPDSQRIKSRLVKLLLPLLRRSSGH